MAEVAAICGECGEAVTSATVEAHMDAHGFLLPDDWKLATWPDGVQVLVDVSDLPNCGHGYETCEDHE